MNMIESIMMIEPINMLFSGDMTIFAEVQRTVFQWGRISQNSDWLLPLSITAAAIVYIIWMYSKDAVELSWFWRVLLPALRILAVLAVLVLYLQPQFRTERQTTVPSRAVVFVDTSLSMGIADQPVSSPADSSTTSNTATPSTATSSTATSNTATSSTPTSSTANIRRWDAVCQGLGDSPLVETLRDRMDVQILAFDSGVRELAFLPKHTNKTEDSNEQDSNEAVKPDPTSAANPQTTDENSSPESKEDVSVAEKPLSEILRSQSIRGQQTQLSDSLSSWLKSQRNTPLSNLVLISDGAQNTGSSPEHAVETIADLDVSVHAVGVGSTELPANVRIYNVQAPMRVQPADPFAITVFVQNQAFEGKSITVEVLSRPDTSAETSAGTDNTSGTPADTSAGTPAGVSSGTAAVANAGSIVESKSVVLGPAADLQPVTFQIPPQTPGKYKYTVRIPALPNETDATDNISSTVVDSVEKKLEILLFAGGPTREYQFVRSLLSRDETIEVDILLQSAQPGVSQDGRKILDTFPVTAGELDKYDGIIAFDPDWNQLSDQQLQWVETWVGDQSGGLIFIAGPVFLGEPVRGWTTNPLCKPLLKICPVEFPRRFSTIGSSRETGSNAYPLNFTGEGTDAEFLRLDDIPTESTRLWSEFEGVFSFFPVERVKDSAVVLARFSDPKTETRGELPPFIVEQFYGSGRTLYLGSGEFWRLRSVEHGLFERLYTQIIRRTTQGRLMRQSDRGTLQPRQERYFLGDTIEVHAQLKDGSGQALKDPQLLADLVASNGVRHAFALNQDPSRAGAYVGRITAENEGKYTVSLKVPQSDAVLDCVVRVELSDLERRNPQRNEPVLKTWTRQTGGEYYSSMGQFTALASQPTELEALFPDRAATLIVAEAIDRVREQQWMYAFLGIIVGLLCLEWLTRRLLKLA